MSLESLASSCYDDTPDFSVKEGPIKVVDIYDADTCKAVAVIGDSLCKITIRLLGLDAPEIRSRKGNDKGLERSAARKARSRFIELCTNTNVDKHESRKKTRSRCANGAHLIRMVPRGVDKYGRVLANLYDDLEEADRGCINDRLVEEGYVRQYDGGARACWEKAELEKILSL